MLAPPKNKYEMYRYTTINGNQSDDQQKNQKENIYILNPWNGRILSFFDKNVAVAEEIVG